MGFSYQTTGGSRLLCCDVCGHAGGCRKVPCPAGFCQAVALCGGCRKNPEVAARLKAYHVENDCAGASAAFDAEQAAVAALQSAGEYVFCASVNDGDGVKCWFRGAAGDTKEAVVSKAKRETLTRLSTYEAEVS